jgi:hypothetical protein
MKLDDHVLMNTHDFTRAIKKLPLSWISENLKEDMTEERKQEIEHFIKTLPNCIKNAFGELSLKRLVSVFGTNLGVHQSIPLKATRTMTRSSRQMRF